MSRSASAPTKTGGIDTQLLIREWRRRWTVKPAAYLAEFLGCPLRTAENWLNGVSNPSGDWVWTIIRVEDPRTLVRVMPNPPAYLVEAAELAERRDQIARRDQLERELAALEADLARAGVRA